MEKIKVLIPTDFSVQADFAYLMVKNIANSLPMDIHFLHVLQVPDTVSMDASGKISTCGEIDVHYVEKQKEIAEQKLAQLQAQYGDEVSTHLLLGKTTDNILSFSASNNFELIVMGTKGASGLKEKLSGTETQMVARRSLIPLLSLMCDRSELNIQNMLMVYDFTQPFEGDISLLRKILDHKGGILHLLHIIYAGSGTSEEGIMQNMNIFAIANGISQFECHLIKDSDVESGVVHFNQMQDMDLIYMGTHGKGGPLHASATEKLINHLYKPVISFRLKK